MRSVDEFMESYQAVWNEQDPERRRKLVAELWAPDGAYVTGANEHKGLEAIEASVARAYEDFVGKGYAFRLASEVAAHHAGVRFTWDMVPVGGGEAAAIGDEFLILDDAGQIKLDYQFMVKMPPA